MIFQGTHKVILKSQCFETKVGFPTFVSADFSTQQYFPPLLELNRKFKNKILITIPALEHTPELKQAQTNKLFISPLAKTAVFSLVTEMNLLKLRFYKNLS